MKKLLYNVFIRPNEWFDCLQEPARFFVFFIPFMIFLTVGTFVMSVPAVVLIMLVLIIQRYVYLNRK
jgi:hypothetical protein